jgi:tRNA threonylcarbamoyladenosine biosynthesis protein TsaB
MKILSFSTVESSVFVALLDGQKIIATNSITEDGKQAELLIPQLEKILHENKIWYKDLNLIATSNGPGSFTGTRIGLTVARTLRLTNNLPLVAVNSCEAIAYKYRQISGKIFTILDAKMNEFFCGEFFAQNQKIKQIAKPKLVRLESFLDIFPSEKFFLCGSGKKIAAEILKKNKKDFEMSEEKDEVFADLIGRLAYEKFLNDASEEKGCNNFDPIYLRSPKISERKK